MVSRSSANAGIHPYLKQDFIWPIQEFEKGLGKILSDEEFEKLIVPEYRKKRTFYFNEVICNVLRLDYYEKGQKFEYSKSAMLGDFIINVNLGQEQVERMELLPEDKFVFVNNGLSWWTAETLWIKSK